MIFGGLDLSIYKKKTAICFIKRKEKFEIFFVKENLSDSQIIRFVKKFKPVYFSIDAPLVWREFKDRKEDKILRRFFYEKKVKVKPGILPFYTKSMIELSRRGRRIYLKLIKYTKVLETHPTASIRAIGFEENYKKNKSDFFKLIKKISDEFVNMGSIKNHNQLDSLFCALFSYYFYKKKNIFICRKRLPYGIVIKLK